MTYYYHLRDIQGCVVHEFRAVKFTGHNYHEVIDTFPSDVVTSAVVQDYGRTLALTDRHGDKIEVHLGHYLFEHPANSGHLLVLSAENFEDTYVLSALQEAI